MALTDDQKRERIVRRIARELRDGFYVNLGIGIPTLVANHVPPGVEVVNYIVTELAVIEVTPEGLVFREIAEDTTVEQVQALTEPRLLVTAGGPQKMLA